MYMSENTEITSDKYKYDTNGVESAIEGNPPSNDIRNTINNAAAQATDAAANAAKYAAETVGDATSNIQDSIINQASFDPAAIDNIKSKLEEFEQRVNQLESNNLTTGQTSSDVKVSNGSDTPIVDDKDDDNNDTNGANDKDDVEDADDKDASASNPNKEDEKTDEPNNKPCPSGYTKFGNDADIMMVLNAGTDAMIVTLNATNMKFDTMLDFIFNYAERILSKCGVDKGELDILNTGELATTLPQKLEKEMAKDAAMLARSINDKKTMQVLVEKLKCIQVKDLKHKYEDFKDNFKENLESVEERVFTEIKSYMKSDSGMSMVAAVGIPMIKGFIKPIISGAVIYAKPVFAVLDPIIESLSKGKLDMDDLENSILKQIPKAGGRKTRKRGRKIRKGARKTNKIQHKKTRKHRRKNRHTKKL